jgi:hypothetical protein
MRFAAEDLAGQVYESTVCGEGCYRTTLQCMANSRTTPWQVVVRKSDDHIRKVREGNYCETVNAHCRTVVHTRRLTSTGLSARP